MNLSFSNVRFQVFSDGKSAYAYYCGRLLALEESFHCWEAKLSVHSWMAYWWLTIIIQHLLVNNGYWERHQEGCHYSCNSFCGGWWRCRFLYLEGEMFDELNHALFCSDIGDLLISLLLDYPYVFGIGLSVSSIRTSCFLLITSFSFERQVFPNTLTRSCNPSFCFCHLHRGLVSEIRNGVV